MQSEGLRWTKVDLHVHTPASRCYECKADAPQQIVEAALEQGLGAIAITDHNSPDWIDKIKAAAEGTPLVVFPGVEISLRDGFHLLALFDPSKNRDRVVGFLGSLDIDSDSFGGEGVLCAKGVSEVLDRIHDGRQGLAILAHIDRPKGAFRVKTSRHEDGRIYVRDTCYRFFNDARYDAVETCNGDLPLGFDRDHNFHRFPAAYKASDNPSPTSPTEHSKDGIGSQYSWFKLDEITLEGLRQCFIDPSTRICNSEACPVVSAPWIESVEFEGGFFDGHTCAFRPGLNALIGAQGAGKSLIVEFLRFGLDQLCEQEALRDDICAKLRERLGSEGRVRITFNKEQRRYSIMRELPTSMPRSVSRAWEEMGSSVPTITRDDGVGVPTSPRELFPVHAYSQGEVVLIAREPEAQLRLIDESLDLSSQREKLQRIVEDSLKPNTDELATVIEAGSRIEELKSKIAAENETIRSLQEKLQSDWFQEIERWRAADGEAKQLLGRVFALEERVATWQQELQCPEDQPRVEEQQSEDEAGQSRPFGLVAAIAQLQKTAVETAREALARLVQDLKGIQQEADGLWAEWKHKLQDTEERHREFLKEAGGEKQELDQRLNGHRERLTRLEEQLRGEEQKKRQREQLLKERQEALDAFNEARREISDLRRSHYQKVSAVTDELLRLHLEESANISSYLNSVDRLMEGSGKRRSTFEILCRAVRPEELVTMVLFGDPLVAVQTRSVDGLSTDRVTDILLFLKTRPSKAILELPYMAPLKDRPVIEYRVRGQRYVPLEELSAGQQMTALQMIILSMGEQPVIIDQPEDSIDTTSVYHNIVQKLRTGKLNRQFILTSHNPNIVVTSDVDRINVLKAGAERGRIDKSGALDRQGVREEAIEHLEGGRESYGIRSDKYGISRPGS